MPPGSSRPPPSTVEGGGRSSSSVPTPPRVRHGVARSTAVERLPALLMESEGDQLVLDPRPGGTVERPGHLVDQILLERAAGVHPSLSDPIGGDPAAETMRKLH